MNPNAALRWTIAAAAVAIALVIGFSLQLRQPSRPGDAGRAPGVDTVQLTELRRRADLPRCSAGPDGGGPAVLRSVSVTCAADGAAVDVAGMLGGRRVVLNFWAYWCAPCRAELPAMVAYQDRAGPEVSVVTVHQDDDEAAALALLAELDVHLPTLQDGGRRIAAALHLPNVMPATVVVDADGSVGRILPQSFSSVDEIAAAVEGRR